MGMERDEVVSVVSQIKSDLVSYQQEVKRTRELDKPVSFENPFVISFVGRFKTGKSSLLNALLGADILPTKATTATSVVTRIFRGQTAKAWFHEKGNKQAITLETAKDLILNYRANDPENPGEIIMELPIPWLSYDVELRDTPGMDDSAQNGLLEKIAMNALKDTDLCICVFDASAMISAKERERTRNIHERMAGNVIYAVNCTNRLNSMKQLQEVENICRTFFGSLKSDSRAVSGMGKFYLMCSAPKMVDLDGFDAWLKLVVSDKVGKTRSAIRKTSAKGQLRMKAAEINAIVSQQKVLLQSCLEDIQHQQREKRDQVYKSSERIHTVKENRIYKNLPRVSSTLCDLSGLKGRLDSCTTTENWQNCYSSSSKNVSLAFFQDNFKNAKNNQNDSFFREISGQFINETFSVITFPGTATIAVAATTGERAGGAAIGAGIGWLFGPVGAIVGGIVGQAIGGADTTKDNSVPNTMQFVEREVVPVLRSAFEQTVREKLKTERASLRKKANFASTGLEQLLADMNNLKRSMDAFLKELEKVNMSISD